MFGVRQVDRTSGLFGKTKTRSIAEHLPLIEGAVDLLIVRRYVPAPPDEVGFAKVFDFSRATTGDRWREGAGDMQAALRALQESQNDREMGLDVHPIPAGIRSAEAGIRGTT